MGGGFHLVSRVASPSLALEAELLRHPVRPDPSLFRQTQLAWRNSREGSWIPSGPLPATSWSQPGEALGCLRLTGQSQGVSKAGYRTREGGGGGAHIALFVSLIEHLLYTRPCAGTFGFPGGSDGKESTC